MVVEGVAGEERSSRTLLLESAGDVGLDPVWLDEGLGLTGLARAMEDSTTTSSWIPGWWAIRSGIRLKE